jgi:hypothetical protein
MASDLEAQMVARSWRIRQANLPPWRAALQAGVMPGLLLVI